MSNRFILAAALLAIAAGGFYAMSKDEAPQDIETAAGDAAEEISPDSATQSVPQETIYEQAVVCGAKANAADGILKDFARDASSDAERVLYVTLGRGLNELYNAAWNRAYTLRPDTAIQDVGMGTTKMTARYMLFEQGGGSKEAIAREINREIHSEDFVQMCAPFKVN